MSYLHKLRSGRTYGAKSQATSDSPVSSASNQNPMLLPPVLDTLFPYLTLNDLKNSRLVCSTWNVVGIPIMARRELPPVDFSVIKSHQEFIALKSEFLKVPSKVNFFQGFRLKWGEMSAMIWNNFLASFKLRALVISGNIVEDPWTNLGHLLLPISRTLTHLDLDIAGDSYSPCPPFATLLNDLADLEGLTLKFLKIGKLTDGNSLRRTTSHDKIQALEKLFKSQSATLEELYLNLTWYLSRPDVQVERHQISLPSFPRLHSLELNLKQNWSSSRIFAPFDFSIIFPKLELLTTIDSLLYQMKDYAIELTRGHRLKKLNIHWVHGFDRQDYGGLVFALLPCFPYIEEMLNTYQPFSSYPSNFHLDVGSGIEILWTSLRILEIFGTGQNFDFRHLKKLESLDYIVNHDGKDNQFPLEPLIELLSDHFLQLPNLKSFHLYYNNMTQQRMDEIREGIPEEFRDFLTIDLRT